MAEPGLAQPLGLEHIETLVQSSGTMLTVVPQPIYLITPAKKGCGEALRSPAMPSGLVARHFGISDAAQSFVQRRTKRPTACRPLRRQGGAKNACF
jgi:hypothetical protein